MNARVFWDPVTHGDLTGYFVYHGIDGVNWDDWVFVAAPTTEYLFTGLHSWKKHYFSVTSFDAESHESDKSQTVWKREPHRLHLK